jgi:hypothetical protein
VTSTIPNTTVTTATTVTSTASAVPAAAAGAAAATATQEEPESTDWGWVAFAILAFAVLAGGLAWWWRGRRDRSTTAS